LEGEDMGKVKDYYNTMQPEYLGYTAAPYSVGGIWANLDSAFRTSIRIADGGIMERTVTQKFWLVMRDPNDKWTMPQYRHATRHSAEVEAERLCKKEGARFYVLEAVKCCYLNTVRWEKMVEIVDDKPIWGGETK